MRDALIFSNQIKDLPVFPTRDAGVDDHTYLRQVQKRGPLVRDDFFRVHTFSHRHLFEMLNDNLTRQIETEGLDMRGVGAGAARDFFANVMLFSNGDVHRRRRAPLARAFAFPLVKAMRGDIRAAAKSIIRPLIGAGEIDFIDKVAGPMPAVIVASILGVPEADIPYFTKLVYSSIRVLSNRSQAVFDAAEVDLAELALYVEGILADRRKTPRGDFLSVFLERVKDGQLDELEVRVQVVGLILAGSDTTRSAIASTFARLLERPDQWAMFGANADRLKADVAAEGLRFDPVVASLGRIAARDFVLIDTRIAKGSLLSLSMLTAMRDPEIYARPDQFDITRKDQPALHPAFGGGAHRCLGEALARVEIEETLSLLAEIAPNSQLLSAPVLRGLNGVRGIGPMSVTLA